MGERKCRIENPDHEISARAGMCAKIVLARIPFTKELPVKLTLSLLFNSTADGQWRYEFASDLCNVEPLQTDGHNESRFLRSASKIYVLLWSG